VIVTTEGSYDADREAMRRRVLEQAGAIRAQRTTLRSDIRSGTVRLAEIIADPPEYVSTMRVFDLLHSDPRLGRLRAERLLDECGIPKRRTFAHLSDRERQVLIGWTSR
jgi:hypothetical protein